MMRNEIGEQHLPAVRAAVAQSLSLGLRDARGRGPLTFAGVR